VGRAGEESGGKGREMKGEGGKGREREEGRKGKKRGKGRAGGAFPQIKIYDYTPAFKYMKVHLKTIVLIHIGNVNMMIMMTN